jgi:hypothetical protein
LRQARVRENLGLIENIWKMVTRGRKQKACFLKQRLGERLQIHLAGKNTKKRQNSTPPGCT